MSHRNGYNVTAVWLRLTDDGCGVSVSVEIGGQWYRVIVDHASLPSHIFELKNQSQAELKKMLDPIQSKASQGGVI